MSLDPDVAHSSNIGDGEVYCPISAPNVSCAPPSSPTTTVQHDTTVDGGNTTSIIKPSTFEAIDRAESAVASLDRKWKAFQNSFDEMNRALVENLARSFGLNPADLLRKEECSPEEQKAVFGGKQPSAQEVASGIRSGKYKKIVVLCGAGMSTSAGIPDFRSPDTGVYAQLKKEQEERKAKFSKGGAALSAEDQKQLEKEDEDRELPTPQSLFDIDFYKQNQMPFILRAGHMWPGKACKYRPTPSHCFLKMIEPQLLRVYTQNIDELETCGGSKTMLPRGLVRRCHGSYERVHCTVCDASYDRGTPQYEAVYQTMVVEGKPSQCPTCLKDMPLWAGVMKPGIVFFGEAMSPEFNSTKKRDFMECDLLIVMGTSLMVSPFSELPDHPAATVPRLLLNGEVVGPFLQSLSTDACKKKSAGPTGSSGSSNPPPNYRDCGLIGDLDASVLQLAKWMGKETALSAVCRAAECRASYTTAAADLSRKLLHSLPASKELQKPTSGSASSKFKGLPVAQSVLSNTNVPKRTSSSGAQKERRSDLLQNERSDGSLPRVASKKPSCNVPLRPSSRPVIARSGTLRSRAPSSSSSLPTVKHVPIKRTPSSKQLPSQSR